MHIPKRFHLKGKVWKVILKKNLKHPDGTECDGLCDLQSRIIYLDSELSRLGKKATFLHELFHAVIHEAHIYSGVRFSEGVEEVLCDAFADLVHNSFTHLKWKKKK